MYDGLKRFGDVSVCMEGRGGGGGGGQCPPHVTNTEEVTVVHPMHLAYHMSMH